MISLADAVIDGAGGSKPNALAGAEGVRRFGENIVRFWWGRPSVNDSTMAQGGRLCMTGI